MGISKLPYDYAKQHQLVLTETGILMSPASYQASLIHQVHRFSGVLPTWKTCSNEEFEVQMRAQYGSHETAPRDSLHDLTQHDNLHTLFQALPAENAEHLENNDAPVIKLINTMLDEALNLGASDIHVEGFKEQVIIRFRVDGILQIVSQSDGRLAAPLTSRLKIMANLDIAEKRIPQDGRIIIDTERYSVDIRVSVIPVAFGERVVLRLLDKKTVNIDIHSIGMPVELVENVLEIINKPHGMMLVTGPTGSGKSTSLYAFLKSIHSPQRNLLTIEDPIEYMVQGIGQTQVNNKAGMTFAKGLRAILRQDPDVIMIGEIRDSETAAIAVQASLTGHMVFSTLHTNTAVGAISRLRDMGIEPYLLSSALSGVLSQRLVRVLCPECKKERAATPAQQTLLGIEEDLPIFHAGGCAACHHTGYRGRTGIYELMRVGDHIRELIHQSAAESDIIRHMGNPHRSLKIHGIQKVLAGITSLEELLRVVDG